MWNQIGSPVKIAIIGTGLIGPRHAEAVLKDPNALLICIVDPNPAAQKVAAQLKTPLYESVSDMLQSFHKPEAAIVCTPNRSHVAISKELLASGVHVLVEKPISVDVSSAKELV
jgi:predicted dehydrogenase